MMSESLLLNALMPVKRISREQFNQRLSFHQVLEGLTGEEVDWFASKPGGGRIGGRRDDHTDADIDSAGTSLLSGRACRLWGTAILNIYRR
jgi:hypothetical protein